MQPVRLGNHELLVRLASGGAANVFLVRDFSAPKSNRLLALKTLLPSLASNEDFLQMFFAEARIASRLKHENIVSITGFGQVEGIHCLAMEYVFGASLSQVLRASARAKRPLTVGVLLRITAAVCDALHFAHEMEDELGEPMGLVHRDVTPQNILISFNGVPKLTDFGIAKATGRGWETQAGIVKGKFSYMSPEQALGKKVDRRSDIFGTGIVLWEALTGRDLFRGSTPMEVLTAIREQKIEAPSKVVSGLTPIVDPIVMRALRRSPRDRYQDSREMRDSILELIERAGVDIDAETISKELYAIYGEEIGKRAVELKKASGGKANLEELAKVLGGMPLNQQQHLPMIPGGVTHPDPLGLFSDHEPVNGVETDAMTSMERPTTEQTPEESWDDSATGEHLEVVSRWNEGSVEAPDEDELLAMLSEEDATVGLLPKEFAAKFGAGLELPEDEGGIVSYQEDEATLGMGNHRVDVMDDYPSVSDAWTPPGLKTIEAEARPDLRRDSSVWGGSRISPSEFESDGGDIPLRSKPRAPSLLIEDAVPSEAHLSPSSSMRP
ncbi:MAG: serine/threonine protein kinase, partial [Myxococcales bacterium]|nr:serine/threonine protein kinase [Myxococcales bacterium]